MANRAIAYAGAAGLRLYSRRARDVSGSYPEVAALDVEAGLVLDGELVAVDERGRPDFGLLQRRMNVTKPTTALVGQVPVQYAVFDVLHRGGHAGPALPGAARHADRAGP